MIQSQLPALPVSSFAEPGTVSWALGTYPPIPPLLTSIQKNQECLQEIWSSWLWANLTCLVAQKEFGLGGISSPALYQQTTVLGWGEREGDSCKPKEAWGFSRAVANRPAAPHKNSMWFGHTYVAWCHCQSSGKSEAGQGSGTESCWPDFMLSNHVTKDQQAFDLMQQNPVQDGAPIHNPSNKWGSLYYDKIQAPNSQHNRSPSF